MYGLVNQAIEDLVRRRFGDAQWATIRSRAGLDVPAFAGMQAYPDAMTYRLVSVASEELGVPADALLEAFGEYWTRFTACKGYGDMRAIGGRSFIDFVQNLDALHAHLRVSMPDLRPPTFWCTGITESALRLHYRSERDGLAPMVIGLVRGLGEVFDTDVRIVQVRSRGDGADHDEFHIEYAART